MGKKTVSALFFSFEEDGIPYVQTHPCLPTETNPNQYDTRINDLNCSLSFIHPTVDVSVIAPMKQIMCFQFTPLCIATKQTHIVESDFEWGFVCSCWFLPSSRGAILGGAVPVARRYKTIVVVYSRGSIQTYPWLHLDAHPE